VAKSELTPNKRFSDTVIKEYSGKAGTIELSSFQTRLIQNYFIGVDTALKIAEARIIKHYSKKLALNIISWNVRLIAGSTN